MKSSRLFPMKMRFASPGDRGVALVLVLAFLVLVSALVLAMFTSSRTEKASADTYASGVTSRQLADMAVNVVQSQISDGTKTWEIPGDPTAPNPKGNGARLVWTSQPGLIRTYSDNQGAPNRMYKLYSARNMVESPSSSDYVPQLERAKEVPDNWPSQRGLYVDLNEPKVVLDPAGTITRGKDGITQKFSAQYPILDPGALGFVDGFKVNFDAGGSGDPNLTPEPVPGFGGSGVLSGGRLKDGYDPGSGVSEGKTANPVPMPVTWMYVLANGKLTAPSGWSSSSKKVYWDQSLPADSRPTKENPIVGRIAFWADDDTCKLNINTASEGTYWDRSFVEGGNPASPYGESQLRDNYPVYLECQRYPGHPATVCLSPVLGKLNTLFRGPTGDNLTKAQHDSLLKPFYDLTPRIGTGGSYGGTTGYGGGWDSPPTVTMERDENRLFSSIDELAFAAPDGIKSTLKPAITDPRITSGGGSKSAVLDRSSLEKAKFFLTAYNRAPDVNVFGRPRISMWMLQQEKDPNGGKPSDDTPYRPAKIPKRPRNAKDELLGFCSTVAGKYPFYFQRYSIYAGSLVNDRARTKRQFPQLPKYGYEPPSSQYPSVDWDPAKMPRNGELYAYLQQLTSAKIPGWGKALADKYSAAGSPSDRDQILTSMIDVMRSGTNAYATANGAIPGRDEPDVRYEYSPARRMPYPASGETQVVPLVIPPGTPGTGSKGYGHFPTITEAALVFHRTSPDKVRVALILEPYNTTAGGWTWSPCARYVVKGLENFTVNGARAFPTSVSGKDYVNLVTSRVGLNGSGYGLEHHTSFVGLFAAFRTSLNPNPSSINFSYDYNKLIPASNTMTGGDYAQFGDPETQYNFISNEVTVPAGTRLRFVGGNLKIEIHTGWPTLKAGAAAEYGPDTLVQTINMEFKPSPGNGWLAPTMSGRPNFSARFAWDQLIQPGDLVRSVEVDPDGPTGGDLRLVAGRTNVPLEYFAGWKGLNNNDGYFSDKMIVHSLREHDYGVLPGGEVHADLIAGTKSPNHPIAARGMTAAMLNADLVKLPGDFDNGFRDEWDSLNDGAYVNKPDPRQMIGVYPNLQVSSPVVFGSLPVISQRNNPAPWRTLLFCAYPAAGKAHPGFASPRDHLFMDFFTMPIVEPYAISEPFSTAGKVNLNYELAPFTYIIRNTALHGVLKSTRFAAFPNGMNKKASSPMVFRKAIDAEQTLALFNARFKKGGGGDYTGDRGVFRTSSEICDMPLVPVGSKYTSFIDGGKSYWDQNKFTGDNVREAPYGTLYARTTTKSNVFTVHVRVQTLRKARPSAVASASEKLAAEAEWDESRDLVLSEYRGSSTIERYIDAGDPNVPDFATNPNAAMDDYYRFRVVGTKRFSP